jgi:hypothetical protein
MPIKEDVVTWKDLAKGALASLIVLAGFAAFLLNANKVAVNEARAEASLAQTAAKQAVATLERKVDANKATADAGNAEVRKDIQALYNYLLTRQRQERLEKR